MEVCDIVQEAVIKTIPKKKNHKKAKWLSEEALIVLKRREVKGKGEKERYTHPNAEFQILARRDKKAFLSDQSKETEENNRMGKTRHLLWRRQWHTIPVLLPGKSHGRRSLVGCSPRGREESDTTERLTFHFSLACTGEGNGNPLQCSCLENPRDGRAWWAAVNGVAQSQTRLKRLSSSSSSSRHLLKKVRDTKGLFHAKMGIIKDRNGMDLAEAEVIKMRWQEYTDKLYKKDLHDPDNHDGVIIHLEPAILKCKVKWALGGITYEQS